ncbi:zinc finger RNA-binding protein [Striga asiatica]|uniref:Zinc finger RNA-binding protein n=1 Tax=Striga asiatica TaxID=4170 RepID=A0A5A7R9Z3_STRAF|nr:zinc finger RNA-binding protein [Striga asiatica]
MRGNGKLEFSPEAELAAFQREVQSQKQQFQIFPPRRTRKWTYTGTIGNAGALSYLHLLDHEPPKVQSPDETPRHRSLSPMRQNRIGQMMVKEEPYLIAPPGFTAPISSPKAGKLSTKREVEKPRRSPSFDWTYTGPVANSTAPLLDLDPPASPKAPFPDPRPNPFHPTSPARTRSRSPNPFPMQKVQTRVETSRPQNRMGRISIQAPFPDPEPNPFYPTSPARTRSRSPNPFPMQKVQTRAETSRTQNRMGQISAQFSSPKPNSFHPSSPSQTRTRSRSPNPFLTTSHLPNNNIPRKPRSGPKQNPAAENKKPGGPYPKPGPNPKPVDELFCQLCQASCSSARTMSQHLNGRAHKAKLKWVQMKKSSAVGRNFRKPPTCEVCGIWCSDGYALNMHLRGKKHEAKVKELEGKNRNFVDKRPIKCELCGIDCMNADNFAMHLKGRAHARRMGRA